MIDNMDRFNKLYSLLSSKLYPMRFGNDLTDSLMYLPEYSDSIRSESKPTRLMALSDLYSIYIPINMSIEIYNKIYMSVINSLKKKCSKKAVQQHYSNYNLIGKIEHNGIIGGADSFTIIGVSGIGKSSAVNRAVSLISETQIIELDSPYVKIIPCLVVQCPFDCSVKSLLLDILGKVDGALDSNYMSNNCKKTIDGLIGVVGQVALNHIGLLIVDEIQNVVKQKDGSTLVNALTQLINNSGISIGMVGTPESITFFESAMHLARRSVGLKYDIMNFDDRFKLFCKRLFEFQYTERKSKLTSEIIEWLYKHSAGIPSVVVSLIHDAQEIAILSEKEIIDLDVLNEAYDNRLTYLHEYIKNYTNPPKKQNRKAKAKKKDKELVIEDYKNSAQEANINIASYVSISELVDFSKKGKVDLIKLLREYFPVEEVNVSLISVGE